jgi:hypothetical protein
MTFFVYPGARAWRVIIDPDGRLHQCNSVEQGFHESSQPTDDRFGHAAYDSRNDTLFLIRADGSGLESPDGKGPVYRPGAVPFEPGRDELVTLPDEVLEAGTTHMSGIVHPRASLAVLWHQGRVNFESEHADWPAESGGAAVFSQILERVRALRAGAPVVEPEGDADYYGDPVLHRLLTPERERQQRGIVAALERVVDLVR